MADGFFFFKARSLYVAMDRDMRALFATYTVYIV